MRYLRAIVVSAFVFSMALNGVGGESPPALKSGPEPGSTVSSFFVRAVTGSQAGKSVCYVCRNGDRPVVIVFLRDLDADITRLLKRLDATVNQHRADGLRCFVVFFSETSQKDSARLQTISFDEKLDIPLTLATEALTGPMTRSIAAEATATVVFYDDLKVINCLSYRKGECDDAACHAVVKAAEELAKRSSPKPAE